VIPVDPGGMSHRTSIWPPVPRVTRPLPARTWLAAKLIVLVGGTGDPVGNSRRSPKSVSPTTVTITATALASLGTLHRPVTWKVRVVLAPSAGPWAVRVFTARHGWTV